MTEQREPLSELVAKLNARREKLWRGRVFESSVELIRHDSPLPFPLGNWRAQCIDGVREALRRWDVPSEHHQGHSQ